MKQVLLKSAIAALTLFYSTLDAFAGPEDHGRWYSLDDDGGSSMSPFGMIIGGIVVVFLGYIMLRLDYEASKETEGKGSNIGCNLLAIIGGIICIILGFSRCGG